jgi:hypothetical protein
VSYALDKDMRRSSVATSAMLHAAVLIVATISFPWLKKTYDEPAPMQVELVDIAQMAQTTKPSPTPAKVEKKIDQPKPEPKKPPPAPTHKTAEFKPPVLKPPDKVEDKPEKVEEKLDENAIPKMKPEKKPDKKPEVKKEEKKQDFTTLLKNLAETKPLTQPTPNAPPSKVVENSGQNIPLGDRMTMLEMDALRKQLEGCWDLPMGARDAETMTVDIFMVINQDRTLQSAQIVDQARYNNDTFFRAMADSAMRAVRNPNCSPFEVPPDKYESWKTVTLTFDPREAF